MTLLVLLLSISLFCIRFCYFALFIQQANSGDAEAGPPKRLEVFLPDASPRPFEMVLSYIYTDRIHPTKKGRGTYRQ